MKPFFSEEDPIMQAALTPRRQSAELKSLAWKEDVEKKAQTIIMVLFVSLCGGVLSVII